MISGDLRRSRFCFAGTDHAPGRQQLLIAGDFLFRCRSPDTSEPNATFQGIWLPAARDGATAVPTFDLSIPASTTARRGFDVDPRARIAVVSTEVPMSSGDPAPALLFYDLSVSPPALVDTLAVDAIYPQLRVAGDRVTAVHSTAIVFFERGQGELSRVTGEFFEIQLLAFDGTTAYAGYLEIVPGLATYSLAAIPFADPATPTAVEVNAIPRSLVAQPGGLAVGFPTQLFTLHPHCPSAATRGAGQR